MNYEELQNSNIPLITLDLIDYSIKVFTYLKDRIKDCNIKDEDLVDLSFFLSVLIGDRFYGTKEILSNYEISEYSVGNYFNIGIGPLVLYCNDQAIDLENTYDKFFKDYFDNLIKDDNKIDTLYPENIIINNLENFFVDNFLYSYVNFNSEKETELVNSLKEMSKKRLDNKDNGITYNRLNSNYLPFETSVMIRNALKWYNLLFINHKYNYNSVDIHNETEKVYLCLFLTILDIPYYEASKQCLNYLSKHNITRKNILKFYNIKEEYLDEMLEYNDEDLEKVYNSVMRKELDKMFFGTWNVGKVYKDILAETILKYVIESDVVFCFFSDHFLFKSNLNELYSIINKLPQNKKYKSNSFNVNNY